jgi:hypothetical protein
LRRLEVIRLYIFPAKLPFTGKVFGQDGRTSIGWYEGQKGIILYAILLDQRHIDRFEAQVDAFAKASGLPKILCKPLQRTFSQVDAQVASDGRGKPSELRFNPKTSSFSLQRLFDEGESLVGSFTLRFQAAAGNVRLHAPRICVDLIEKGESSEFRAASPEVAYEPVRLAGDLIPGVPSEPVRVNIRLHGGVNYTITLQSLFKYLTNRETGRYRARIRVWLEAPWDSISLAEEVWRNYGTDDLEYFTQLRPDLQERIFGLNRLFVDVAADTKQPKTIELALKDYFIVFYVKKPLWPVWLVLGIIVLPVVLFFLLRWMIRAIKGDNPQAYFLKSSGDENFYFCQHDVRQPTRDAFSTSQQLSLLRCLSLGEPIFIGGESAGVIRLLPIKGFRVVAKSGFLVNGDYLSLSLRPGGTRFTLKRTKPKGSQDLGSVLPLSSTHRSKPPGYPD